MNANKPWRDEPAWSTALDSLAEARKVVVLTGAGISAESGIPTFRDNNTGFWQNYSLEDLATPAGFAKDMALVWGWYAWRRKQMGVVAPNPGHLALAALEAHFDEFHIVTQNVDDLHERSGSQSVVHLHGQLHRNRCFSCAATQAMTQDDRDQLDAIDLDDAHREVAPRLAPPRCTHCGCPLRPDVVWFGESLAATDWDLAEQAVGRCDLALCVGTSGIVYPAAALPAMARKAGATVVQVNPQQTALDSMASINLYGRSGEVLPDLLEAFLARPRGPTRSGSAGITCP